LQLRRRGVLSMLLWTWGGTAYFLLEVLYKTVMGEPERISWTMLVLAMFLCVPVERCGAELPWEMPLWLQAAACAALVPGAELAAGLVLNVWLKLGVWDYSALPWNLWGQVCPQFAAAWGSSPPTTGCAGRSTAASSRDTACSGKGKPGTDGLPYLVCFFGSKLVRG